MIDEEEGRKDGVACDRRTLLCASVVWRPAKVNDACPHCGEELFHQRSDDAPPYMTIFVVGNIIGTFMILVEEFWPDAPIWLHAMVWPTITLILSLWLLPIIKGGLIGHQWALRMHGFETVGRAAKSLQDGLPTIP